MAESEPPVNIVCFTAAVRLVLSTLYAQFPKSMMLDSSQLVGQLPEFCPREWGPSYGSDNVVAATIRFLADEGFLRHSGLPGDAHRAAFPDVVLTARGFVILQQPLEVLAEPRPTVAQEMKRNLSISDLVAFATSIFKIGEKIIPH